MSASIQAGWWVARGLLAEAGWWLRGVGRLVSRHPWRSLLWAWAVGVAGLFGRWHVAVVVAGVVVVPLLGFGLWARLGPVSFQRRVSDPAFRRRTRRWLHRSWPTVMEACGLARRAPGTTGTTGLQVPVLRRLAWSGGQLVASPVLLVGQTIDDIETASDRLRVSVNATRVRVVVNDSLTGCRIVWSFGDPLATQFDATVPLPTDPLPSLAAVTLGKTEDGELWRLPLGVSTLTAGSTGSGKASLIWGLVFGLAPAIRTGLVQVHGIDLKGGMEFAMGRALFTRYAQQADQAVVMLEDAARELQDRAARLAGHTRQHTPTVAEPLVVVLVDGLAALVAYLPDRDLTRRAEAALNVVLSQGRAVGFFVFGFLQDPRKETVKMRHLFTQSLGLRLRDREEVAMVLGDGAVAAGAWCHKIPRATPGVGFVLGEDGRPVRVRAGYVSDAMIRACAALFPAPRQVPILVGEPQPARSSRRRDPTGDTGTDGDPVTGDRSARPSGRRSRAAQPTMK